MAVPAVDAQSGHVMLMAEGYRLLALDPLIGGIRRADHAPDDPQHESDDKDSAEDRDASKSIRTAVENLRHYRLLPSNPGISIRRRGALPHADYPFRANGGDHIEKRR